MLEKPNPEYEIFTFVILPEATQSGFKQEWAAKFSTIRSLLFQCEEENGK